MKRTIITSAFLCGLLLVAAGGCAQSQSTPSKGSAGAGGFADARAEPGLETPLEQMMPARIVGKISVPVEVRYQLAREAVRDQPTPLELAFLSRVEGRNLKIEFIQSESVTVESPTAPLTEQKFGPARVIRRNLLVTPRKTAASEVRMLVSMDVDGGRFFSVFSIPIRGERAER